MTEVETLSALQDGTFAVPPGKIVAVVTYLGLGGRPARPPAPARSDVTLQRLRAAEIDRYRDLFRSVGGPWLWTSRLMMADAALAAILDDPKVEACALVLDGRDVGIVELDARDPAATDLSFLGLVREATGRGLGPWLLDGAIDRAFAAGAAQMTVNTCTLDHPAALRTYMAAGFTPYRRAVVVADDPRLNGRLSPDAAPGVPVI